MNICTVVTVDISESSLFFLLLLALFFNLSFHTLLSKQTVYLYFYILLVFLRTNVLVADGWICFIKDSGADVFLVFVGCTAHFLFMGILYFTAFQMNIKYKAICSMYIITHRHIYISTHTYITYTSFRLSEDCPVYSYLRTVIVLCYIYRYGINFSKSNTVQYFIRGFHPWALFSLFFPSKTDDATRIVFNVDPQICRINLN